MCVQQGQEAARTGCIQSWPRLCCGTLSLAPPSLFGAVFLGAGEGSSGLPGCLHGSAGCHGASLPGTEVLPRARRSKTNLLDHFNKWRRDVVVCE